MDVQRAPVRRAEQLVGDPVPVGGPHQNLRSQRHERDERRRVQARRLEHRDFELPRGRLRRRLTQNAARSRTVGLRDDADDLDGAALAETVESLERPHGERRRAQEENAGR